MTPEELLASARAIPVPTESAAREYEAKRERLAAEMNRIMGARPDLTALIGEGNRPMMEDNHRNHARFIASLLLNFSPEVLVETVLWVFRAYRAHGFRLAYWPAQLDTWTEVLKAELTPEAFASVEPVYRWMIVRQPAFAALSDAALAPPPPTHERPAAGRG